MISLCPKWPLAGSGRGVANRGIERRGGGSAFQQRAGVVRGKLVVCRRGSVEIRRPLRQVRRGRPPPPGSARLDPLGQGSGAARLGGQPRGD